jgi:hypothetical protein
MKMSNDRLRIYRVACLTIFNAMLFQEILSRHKGVKTLREVLDSYDPVGVLAGEWKKIERDIDFVPIFKVARKILLTLPSTPETYEALRRLGESAIKISRNRSALRHDLMGRIFHRLLADAKYYGAFYTKIPAATMLLQLAIRDNEWDVDWSDPASLAEFKIADLSCGTGTLLKASLEAAIDKHVDECVEDGVDAQTDAVHAKLVESSLWGFDVISSAVHLAASALAMHDPNVTVDRMHVYALPLGGKMLSLGSIDFAGERSLNVQTTLIGASIGPEEATSRKKLPLTLPKLDICTMNPPFTRSVYNNLLFGNVGESDRADLQQKLGEVVRENELKANITAGLGSVFVAIADRLLKKNGVLALVLPKSVLSGSSWEPTRSIFAKYHIQYIVSSHEPGNWNFSESSDLSEVLLVLRKGENTAEPTVFVNLWEQPKSSMEALAIVRAVKREEPAWLDKTGLCEINVGEKKYGEVAQLSLREHNSVPWAVPMSFAQTDLCRMAVALSEDKFVLPGSNKSHKLQTVPLGKVASLGPDGRDVYDGFALAKSHTRYSALWGYDAMEMSQLSQTTNQYLAPLTRALQGRNLRNPDLLWSRAGTLMLPKELRLTTGRVTGVVLPDPALSNVWWPTKWVSEKENVRRRMERRLCLWFNSSLGILTMLMQRQETEGSWVKFPKAWYEKLRVGDLRGLGSGRKDSLDELWKKINSKTLLPFPEIQNDEVRATIDIGVADALGLPSFEPIRNLLGREPMMSMEVNTIES